MVGSAIGSILIADLAAVAGDRYNHQVVMEFVLFAALVPTD